MIEVISITGIRNFTNEEATPDGHWVKMEFRNAHGLHIIELNGEQPLPDDPALRRDLEWLLWDYGLLSQDYGSSAAERAEEAENQLLMDRLNYLPAKAYLERLGAVDD